MFIELNDGQLVNPEFIARIVPKVDGGACVHHDGGMFEIGPDDAKILHEAIPFKKKPEPPKVEPKVEPTKADRLKVEPPKPEVVPPEPVAEHEPHKAAVHETTTKTKPSHGHK